MRLGLTSGVATSQTGLSGSVTAPIDNTVTYQSHSGVIDPGEPGPADARVNSEVARLDDVGLVTEGSDAKLNIDFNNNAEVILKIPGGGFTSLMAATPRPSTRSGFSSSTRLWTAGCASRRRATLAAPGSRWTSSVAPTRWPRCPSPRRSCSGARRRPAWPSPAGAVDTAGRFSGLRRVDDANAKATPIETAVTREQSVGLLRRVRPDQKVRHNTVP